MSSTNKHAPKFYDDLLLLKSGSAGGCFKVRVLKKWNTDDVYLPGRIASVDMILMDKNVSFFVDYCILPLDLWLNISFLQS
jgi:hypothetical protein